MIYVKAVRVKRVRGFDIHGRLIRGWRASWWENRNGTWYGKQTQVCGTLPALWEFMEFLFNRPEVKVIKRCEVKL